MKRAILLLPVITVLVGCASTNTKFYNNTEEEKQIEFYGKQGRVKPHASLTFECEPPRLLSFSIKDMHGVRSYENIPWYVPRVDWAPRTLILQVDEDGTISQIDYLGRVQSQPNWKVQPTAK